MTDHAAPQSNGGAGYLPAAFAAVLFALFALVLPRVEAGEVLPWSMPWLPSLGVAFAVAIDGLSLTFSLLISGIGALVLLYSNTYLAGHPQWWRFALFLTAFMLSMLGLVLADDLISLFVFWELTTITSYLLIGFGHETETGRRSALQALFVTGAGALAMLAGLILLGNAAGTFRISEIVLMGEALRADPMYLPILILVLAGAFTKSAQFPLHFWLPNAMAAPTPVSAFLHSATMVKGGVYLMARLHPALSGTEAWLWTLTLFGGFTAVFASVLALRQTDLKQALAYTTLMALGTLTMTLAQPGAYAVTAFATFLVAHSLYKASLFLMVGCIDHGTGTREADRLGGLARAMPVTALAAALAALSMAGLPPLIGFISKELQYAGAVEAEGPRLAIVGAALAANALMFAVAGTVALRPFFGRASGEAPPVRPHEAPWQMLAGPLLLAAAGLAFGLAPWLIQDRVIAPSWPASSATRPRPRSSSSGRGSTCRSSYRSRPSASASPSTSPTARCAPRWPVPTPPRPASTAAGIRSWRGSAPSPPGRPASCSPGACAPISASPSPWSRPASAAPRSGPARSSRRSRSRACGRRTSRSWPSSSPARS